MFNFKKKYFLDYYIDFVDKFVVFDIDVFGIKDMVGVFKFYVVIIFIGIICKKYFDFFIYVYIYDFVGIGVVFMVVCVMVGVDVVDVVIDSLFGMILQFSINVIIVLFDGIDKQFGFNFVYVCVFDIYWFQFCFFYLFFEVYFVGFDFEVYEYEIFGGQFINMMFQVFQFGFGFQWLEIKKVYE